MQGSISFLATEFKFKEAVKKESHHGKDSYRARQRQLLLSRQ